MSGGRSRTRAARKRYEAAQAEQRHAEALKAAAVALITADATHDGAKPWSLHAAEKTVSAYLAAMTPNQKEAGK